MKVEKRISYPAILSMLVSVCLLDQISKWLVIANLQLGQVVPVLPGCFNFTYVLNPGVAFGMFSDLPDGMRYAVLTFTTLLALGVVIYFLYYEYYHDRIAQLCLAAIVGGAFGNIIDRALHGKVVDFIDWYYGTYHWPAFNIADSAICVGVTILIFRKPAERGQVGAESEPN